MEIVFGRTKTCASVHWQTDGRLAFDVVTLSLTSLCSIYRYVGGTSRSGRSCLSPGHTLNT